MHLLGDARTAAAGITHSTAMDGITLAAPCLFAILCAGFVASGLLTPVVQTLVILFEVGRPTHTLLLEVAVAASLTLLGPGAYSLDSRLFGREEIRIPPRTRPFDDSSTTSFGVDRHHPER